MDKDLPCRTFANELSLRHLSLKKFWNKNKAARETERPWPNPIMSDAKNELQRREKFPHPFQPAIQFLFRRRIGNANMLSCAESFAGNGGHMCFPQ
jgi:hypothetical protein